MEYIKYIRNNTITGKIVTRKMLKTLICNICYDTKFTKCTFDMKNLINKESLTNFFKFCNCVFEECKFNDNNGKNSLELIKCIFRECSFSFDKYSMLHFTNSEFILTEARKSNFIDTGCKFHILEFNQCKLEGLICNYVGLNTYNCFKCNNLMYTPTDDRVRKDGTINEDPLITRLCPLKCPEEGSFIGWKQVEIKKEGKNNIKGNNDKAIIPTLAVCKLEIPKNALRSSGSGIKCRCNKAKVLEITELTNDTSNNMMKMTNIKHKKAYSIFCDDFEYKVGKMVKCSEYKTDGMIKCRKKFDNDRFHECSSGIHFFMSKRDAMDY